MEQRREELQWDWQGGAWGFRGAYQRRADVDAVGVESDQETVAGEVARRWGDGVTVRLGHQETLAGEDNSQSRAEVDYRITSGIGLQGSVMRGAQGDAAEVGVQAQLGDTRVYLKERQSRDIHSNESLSEVV